MRRMLLPVCLLLAGAPLSAAAAEACDVPPRFGLSPFAMAAPPASASPKPKAIIWPTTA